MADRKGRDRRRVVAKANGTARVEFWNSQRYLQCVSSGKSKDKNERLLSDGRERAETDHDATMNCSNDYTMATVCLWWKGRRHWTLRWRTGDSNGAADWPTGHLTGHAIGENNGHGDWMASAHRCQHDVAAFLLSAVIFRAKNDDRNDYLKTSNGRRL